MGFKKQNCRCGAIIVWPEHTDGKSRIRGKILFAKGKDVCAVCSDCGGEVRITDQLRAFLSIPATASAS